MMFLCFSSVQFENFLYGIQLEPFFPGIALVAIANINLSALSFRSKLLANLTLASIATYTFANGMLLLVLGLPLANPSNSTPIRRRTRWFCIYALCAAIAIGCYFIGYKKPSYHPDFASWHGRWLDLTHYLVLWIGAYFASDYVNPFLFGIVASAVFVAVFASMIVILAQDRNWHTFYPWLLIAAYALGTGIITALGRIGFGVQQALDNRYTVFSLFFYLALVGGTFALYCARVRRGGQGVRACFLTNIGYLLGFTALCWTACYPKNFVSLRNHRHHQLQLRLALEWMDVIPDNPELALVFPYVDVLRTRARTLADHQLLRIPFVKEQIAAQVKQPPTDTDAKNGRIEFCGFDSNHSLLVTGWAWLAEKNQRADCVVIGYRDTAGKFKPFTVLETGVPRPDLRERFHIPNMYRAGFSRAVSSGNLADGDLSIEGWAIDVKRQKALPLASSLSLHAARP